MRCIHLAINPSLGSYNLLVFSVWSFSNRGKSQVKFIWTNKHMIRTDFKSPDPPFPYSTSQVFLLQKPIISLVKLGWKCSFTCQEKGSSLTRELRQPPAEASVYMMDGDPLLQLGRLGQSSQKSVKPGQLTAVKKLAKGTNRMEKG